LQAFILKCKDTNNFDDFKEMKTYREAGPSNNRPPTATNVQQSVNAIKIDSTQVQDLNNQPQQVQVQYVDQEGNVIHVINQPASFVTNDGVYVNNGPSINESNYDNA
jgi:hypothetical protein